MTENLDPVQLPDPALLRLLCEKLMGWEHVGSLADGREPDVDRMYFDISGIRVLGGESKSWVDLYTGLPAFNSPEPKIFDPLSNLNDAATITGRLVALGWNVDISILPLADSLAMAGTIWKADTAHWTEHAEVGAGDSVASTEARLRCRLAAWAVENEERKTETL